MSRLRRETFAAGAGQPERLDYPVLVATLQAIQLATPTARAESRMGASGESAAAPGDPLTEILLGKQHWQDAVLAQGGSFNPAFACGAEQR